MTIPFHGCLVPGVMKGLVIVMKCQKCGISEVSFHYSSNVNGCVTETHLCSQCAEESGFDLEKMFDQEQFMSLDQSHFIDLSEILNEFFPIRGVSGFVPLAIPMKQSKNVLPFSVHPIMGVPQQGSLCDCGCGQPRKNNINIEIDEEMKIRRELNAQMHTAVANEEFEKAAELRDKIKELENNTPDAGRSKECDLGTIIQDSPTAQ